jgi:hypothetical protein
MIPLSEAKERNLEQLTLWLPRKREVSSRWGLISAEDWVVREALRLGSDCEPVWKESKVSIWCKAQDWRPWLRTSSQNSRG